jgi:hypothetical protein
MSVGNRQLKLLGITHCFYFSGKAFEEVDADFGSTFVQVNLQSRPELDFDELS